MESIPSALAAMAPHFVPLAAERLGLLEARGRFLARDVLAVRDLPGFDNSAMDGYALRFAASMAPGDTLSVVGEAAAGNAPGTLTPGSAMRIFTGAPLPAGADTVLMQENTEAVPGASAGAHIRLTHVPARAGQHVRARGEDVKAGDLLLPRGAHLGPGEIALLAAQGIATVDVPRRPRVAILTTGDELRELGEALSPGSLVNSNAYGLSAQVAEAGGEPWVLPKAEDDVATIAARIRDARQADVLITAGGVSVGDYDLVAAALSEVGVERIFWKVAMKPGKPVWFGRMASPAAPGPDDARATPVLGLPGNPVSAMVTFELFARPGLQAMLGNPAPYPAPLRVALAHPHTRSPGRVELARGRLDHRHQPPRVTLCTRQGSGNMRSMAGAHVLVVLPGERERFEAGEHLQALTLPAGLMTDTHGFAEGGEDG